MTVYSNERTLTIPQNPLPDELPTNRRVAMDGLTFMSKLPEDCIAAAFFDPQYRGVLDKLSYGNEGVLRGQKRSALPQMSSDTIAEFIRAIHRVLGPSGHIFLWIDKFHLCSGIDDWIRDTTLETVDLITWNKTRIGMGYRTRRTSEYLIILQKAPKRAKGVWTRHDIRDVWKEKAPTDSVPPETSRVTTGLDRGHDRPQRPSPRPRRRILQRPKSLPTCRAHLRRL